MKTEKDYRAEYVTMTRRRMEQEKKEFWAKARAKNEALFEATRLAELEKLKPTAVQSWLGA